MLDWTQAWPLSATNPKLFVTDVLGVSPEGWQAEALDALGTQDRLAIRSGHGVGKTTFECWAVLWFILTRYPTKIPVTANSQDQLRDVVWAELAQWYRRLPSPFQDQLELTTERLHLKARPAESFAVARTASRDRPEALQGFHSPNLLYVIEEASGIEEIVFQVAQGALSTPGAKVIMAGNPTRNEGYFYRAFHDLRGRWWTKRVSSADVPRARGHVEETAEAYGEDSNVYRVRVLGEFPTADDDAVIPLYLVEGAQMRQVEANLSQVVWGLDVARFGDDRTALIKRTPNAVLGTTKVWRNKDTMQVAGLIKQEWDSTPRHLLPQTIYVDVIGLGAGVVDRLKEERLPVRGINVGEAAPVKDRYARLRDELWFRAREWLDQKHCRMPKDNDLAGELCTVKYEVLPTGKIKVESKEEMKRRGVRSPDLADAFVLTFAPGSAQKAKRIEYPQTHISRNIV